MSYVTTYCLLTGFFVAHLYLQLLSDSVYLASKQNFHFKNFINKNSIVRCYARRLHTRRHKHAMHSVCAVSWSHVMHSYTADYAMAYNIMKIVLHSHPSILIPTSLIRNTSGAIQVGVSDHLFIPNFKLSREGADLTSL